MVAAMERGNSALEAVLFPILSSPIAGKGGRRGRGMLWREVPEYVRRNDGRPEGQLEHGTGERQLDGGTVSVRVPRRDGISDLGKKDRLPDL